MKKKEIFPDIFLIENTKFRDNRGSFQESYNRKTFSNLGINNDFIQDNISISNKEGTIRGLHFQKGKSAQSKLIYVTSGKILDIFVDIRENSKTFGEHSSIELSEKSGCLFIPKGFAHGFCTLEDNTSVLYKVDNFYDKESDSGVIWNDASLNISWPIFSNYYISDKDKKLTPFNQLRVKDNLK